jgi:precorrin-2 dehydrogenase/sirohydrochlorin ferrochelatase
MTVDAGYPLILRIAGQRCVVVGGGSVAARKVRGLIVSGADVLAVAPEIGPELAALAEHGTIRVGRRAFEPSDLDGALLAFAATNDRAVNEAVVRAAQDRDTIVNVADDPAACDFTVPAVVRRGDVMLAISTGGRSPAFARFLREQLEAWLTDARCALLDLAAELRRELQAAGVTIDSQRWQAALADEAALAALAEGDRESAHGLLREILTAES